MTKNAGELFQSVISISQLLRTYKSRKHTKLHLIVLVEEPVIIDVKLFE